MMRSEPQSGNSTRTPATLSAKLNTKLVSYVAAASAGVGLLAGAQPADAEVVYTPANTPILINTPVALDLNNDGIVDFELSNNYRAFDRKSCTNNCTFGADATLKVTPEAADNAIWFINVASHHSGDSRRKTKKDVRAAAAPVPWGVVVGPERKLQAAPTVMHSDIFSGTIFGFASYKSFGPWGENRQFAGPYLGLKFTAGGVVHYGWARITVQVNQLTITATLTGYAYETIANRPVITGVTRGSFDAGEAQVNPSELKSLQPQPASLGQLALGAPGRASSKIQ